MLEIEIDRGIDNIDTARDLILIRRFCIIDEEERREKLLQGAVELETAVKALLEAINR